MGFNYRISNSVPLHRSLAGVNFGIRLYKFFWFECASGKRWVSITAWIHSNIWQLTDQMCHMKLVIIWCIKTCYYFHSNLASDISYKRLGNIGVIFRFQNYSRSYYSQSIYRTYPKNVYKYQGRATTTPKSKFRTPQKNTFSKPRKCTPLSAIKNTFVFFFKSQKWTSSDY